MIFKVTPAGELLSDSESSRATYSTMVLVRSTIVDHSFMFVSQATTIATRYSSVRRQSELKPGYVINDVIRRHDTDRRYVVFTEPGTRHDCAVVELCCCTCSVLVIYRIRVV